MAFQFPNSPTVGQQVPNTASGQTFTWDGTSWNTTPITSSQAITSSFATTASYVATSSYSLNTDVQFRNYFPTRSVSTYAWRTFTTTPAQYGFTAVGGATIAYFGSPSLYGGQYMFECNATRATTVAAEWTVPTSYLRYEGAITPGVSNVFSFSTLSDRSGFVGIDVWICNPTTGTPEKKLIQNGTEINAAGINASKTTYLDPWGSYGQYNYNFIWLNYSIPKTLIDTYKTGTNTIRLALRPNNGNTQGNLWYLGGLAMTSNPYNFINVNAATQEWLNSPAYSNGGWIWDNSNWNYRSLRRLDASTTGTVSMPIVDPTKPMILTSIFAADASQGFMLSWNEYSLVSTAGATLNIGRPKRSIIAPSVLTSNFTNFGVGGWIITPEQIAQYAIPASTFNANSAYSYLRLQANPAYLNPSYFSGFVAETLN